MRDLFPMPEMGNVNLSDQERTILRSSLIDRFLKYVKIDTQSEEDVEGRYPSTEKQKVLARLLVEELKSLGLTDAAMDAYGIVTATLPANYPTEPGHDIPVLGLLAHLDTSPEVSGTDVKAVYHAKYNGDDIILPGDSTQVIRVADNPELSVKVGADLITSDGTTLLGADDKAGIAEIMTLLELLSIRSDVIHGTLRIGFTPDEEVGGGTRYFDVSRFGADFAYTVDGGSLGEIEDETFNGSVADFIVRGRNVHPGYAKGKMVNAVRIASSIIAALGDDPAPEETEDREGYLHPYIVKGGVESVHLRVLIRDFEVTGMEQKSERLESIRKDVLAAYPGSKISLSISPQYANMHMKLSEDPRPVEFAIEAVRQAGIKPVKKSIRGGTDGARLSFQGLPTPNIFTGGHNFHSRMEWIAVEDMVACVEMLVHLVQIWSKASRSP